MFPLKDKTITGYRFGVPTFYSSFHLGVDYGTENMELMAPFDGVVKTAWGSEGGNTMYFYPDGKQEMIRFLHLDHFLKTGRVRKGDKIAITGNTGNSTRGHLHLDISKNGVLHLTNRSNFINPELYDWGKGNMNQAKVVKSKNSDTVYVCYPIPLMDYLKTKSEVEGFTVPNPIPNSDSL
jgi:murein DD-endopeptidase MepM/ murein hydrolase activator NlpD